MDGRLKFILTLIIICIIFFLSIIFIMHGSMIPRSMDTLLSQYDALQSKNPAKAREALELIIEQFPFDQQAKRELGYWYLKQKDMPRAIKQFNKALRADPNDFKSAEELANLYAAVGQTRLSDYIKKLISQNNTLAMMQLASSPVMATVENAPAFIYQQDMIDDASFSKNEIWLQNIANKATWIRSSTFDYPKMDEPQVVVTKEVKIVTKDSKKIELLNKYYNAKKAHDNQTAWKIITDLAKQYPIDLQILKEAGYFALSEKKYKTALIYFKRAYKISCDSVLAMQMGYILDMLHKRQLAYYYFDLATRTNNLQERWKAEIAKTNIQGSGIKILPDPFFMDFFYTPFYHSRFQLVISPIIYKAGLYLNKKYNVQFYFSFRRTTDNKSTLISGLPSIYQDSAAIYALGLSFTPFPSVPLVGFMEAGRAFDIVYQNRGRWRGDLRYGAAYYQAWGNSARYTFGPTIPFKFVGDVYLDAIYYSRYVDWIGNLRIRPGFEIFRSHASSIILYYKAFLVQDIDRIYYNNILERGPGIAFIPSDRYNIAFRYENLQGNYLPSGGLANPYGAKYHNNIIEMDLFVRL